MDDCRHIESLESKGLRRTRDRHRILRMFDRDRAWTVAQLHSALPRMDLSTVYRNVEKLVDAGIVHEVHIHGKEAYYEPAGRSHHDHVICERCATTSCIPCPITKLGASHSLELLGMCESCAA